ncbi:hypothetical protein [Novosphingobium sp. KN65.2]|uniref:hypothetical protein n=1 Tax=Novosphingobium sp. KN65.2 TaxID=1478134 RepID=UPI0005E0B632|nr:hypothetical protein [Novosphingobium sp. KN65.2]CDO34066.1 hypothetical protein SPHV1_100100 [Novosphingobium sp. KN65.2]
MMAARPFADAGNITSTEEEDAILLDLARRDAMRSMRFEVPDAEEYARRLPAGVVEALKSGWKSPTGFRVTSDRADLLRPYSLVECKGTHLSAFGLNVRRVLLQWDREEAEEQRWIGKKRT